MEISRLRRYWNSPRPESWSERAHTEPYHNFVPTATTYDELLAVANQDAAEHGFTFAALSCEGAQLYSRGFGLPHGPATFDQVVRHLASELERCLDVDAIGLYPAPPWQILDVAAAPYVGWAASPLWVVRVPIRSGATASSLVRRRLIACYAFPADYIVADMGLFATLETSPAFNPQHYPKGVNANFAADTQTLITNYTGAKGLFENAEGRELAQHAPRIAELCHELLKQTPYGNRGAILELGCGTGLFTALLAKQAKDVKIIATETSAGFLELCRKRRDEDIIPRDAAVVFQHTPADALPDVPTGAVSLCAIIDVYHHLEFPLTMLQEVRRTMYSGALLLLIDFHRDPLRHRSHSDPQWVLDHVRGDQATFEAEVLSYCQFEKVQDVTVDGISENYVVLFRAL